jgi:hypothetical protein
MATWAVKIGTYAIGTSAAISAIKLMRSRRVTEHPIVRSDMTIIGEGKQSPLRIDLTGTCVGTDYTSTRTELKNIIGASESTTQSFFLDNERYCRVVSRNFDYSFVKQDYCNYNLSLMGELPYFLASAADSYIAGVVGNTLGITSGTAFNVSNLGDIKIPCKIVLTGAGAATISNNVQFENTTLGTLCKFTGTLQITSTLVIDMGYDYHNVPNFIVTLDGVNAMSAFEGDFIELAAGSNAIEYTGAQTGTISIYYRKEFYS